MKRFGDNTVTNFSEFSKKKIHFSCLNFQFFSLLELTGQPVFAQSTRFIELTQNKE